MILTTEVLIVEEPEEEPGHAQSRHGHDVSRSITWRQDQAAEAPKA